MDITSRHHFAFHAVYRDRVFLSVMLEDQLLEVQERPFMRDLLSHLYECFPGILCRKFCAI